MSIWRGFDEADIDTHRDEMAHKVDDGQPAPYQPTLDELIAQANTAVTDLRTGHEAGHSRDLARQQQADRDAAQQAEHCRELH